MRVAVIGAGVAGLGAAWALRNRAEVVLFEQQTRLGGHSNTVEPVPGQPVDTGFIVYNLATYPNLIALFDTLGIKTQASDMSFAVSMGGGSYEYSGDSLGSMIGGWRNLFDPAHWRMLRDLVRFMRNGANLAKAPADESLGAFLDRHGYNQDFRRLHLLPMAAAIWSASPADILDFPARSFGTFFQNHGLLELDTAKRPQWRTVTGGSREYVGRLATAGRAIIHTGIQIARIDSDPKGASLTFTDGSADRFDQVVFACHADEALALLGDTAPPRLRQVLAPFRYSANTTYLHRDPALMPRRQRLWASWNYLRPDTKMGSDVFVSYWMNRLQGIDKATPYFVTLNPTAPPRADLTYRTMTYHHPQFDRAAIEAQAQLRQVQGSHHFWFCGSYCGYGFHEDALASGLAVAAALGAPRPWPITDVSPAYDNALPLTPHE